MNDAAKKSGWTDEAIGHVRELAEVGLSAREIAANLMVTRNAIIGVCSRRGITLKGSTKASNRSSQERAHGSGRQKRTVGIRRSLPNLKSEPAMVLPAAPPSVTPISLHELTNDRCHWPLGDFADRPPYQYCGAKVAFAGLSWCPYHRRLAGLDKETSHAHRAFKAEAA